MIRSKVEPKTRLQAQAFLWRVYSYLYCSYAERHHNPVSFLQENESAQLLRHCILALQAESINKTVRLTR